jgi:hypothetical protein
MPFSSLNLLQIANYTYKKCKIGANIAPISYYVYSQLWNLMQMKKITMLHIILLVVILFLCPLIQNALTIYLNFALLCTTNEDQLFDFSLMFSYGFY